MHELVVYPLVSQFDSQYAGAQRLSAQEALCVHTCVALIVQQREGFEYIENGGNDGFGILALEEFLRKQGPRMLLAGDKTVGVALCKETAGGKTQACTIVFFNVQAGGQLGDKTGEIAQIGIAKKKQGAIPQPYPVDARRSSLFK